MCSAYARKMLHMPQCMWLTANLTKRLEVAQRSCLSRMSNFRAWVSCDSNTASPASWYKLLSPLVTTTWVARQLLNVCLPFSDSNEQKRSMWPCNIVRAIVYRKFRLLTHYQLDKNWLSSGSTCGDEWLNSIFLFLYCSDGILVAVLGSSWFVWHMHCWDDIHSFGFCHEFSIELTPITLINCCF